MKKSLIAFVLFVAGLLVLVSCSADSAPNVNFHLRYLPAESVEVPLSLVRGQRYSISVYYRRPDNCHYFNGVFRRDSGATSTIAVEAMVLDNVNCEPVQSVTPDVATFDFDVPLTLYGTYQFKFYNGVDNAGQDTFIIKDVPVAP
jgi:hypothetical protein